MKALFYFSVLIFSLICLLSILTLPGCTSMISGVSLTSLLSGKSIRLCPDERKAIIDEAVIKAVESIKQDQPQ